MKVGIYQLEKYKTPACNKIKSRLWKPLKKILVFLELWGPFKLFYSPT